MTDDEFDQYLSSFSGDQTESLRELRSLIKAHANGLDETENTGRWLKGFVFYSFAGQMIYAIGPNGKTKTSLHMMPFYGSPALQQRHGEVLSAFLTGKSCLAFRRCSDLPIDAVTDIIRRGTPVMVSMIEEHVRNRRERRAP